MMPRLSCNDQLSVDLEHETDSHIYNDGFLVWHDGQDLITGHIEHYKTLAGSTPYVIYDMQLNSNSTAFTGKGIVYEDNSRPTCNADLAFPITISGNCDGTGFQMISDYPGGFNVTAAQITVLCHEIGS